MSNTHRPLPTGTRTIFLQEYADGQRQEPKLPFVFTSEREWRLIDLRIGTESRGNVGLSVMSWSRAFHIPIPLPDGRVLRTLQDAGEHIQELPRETLERPDWQIAAEMLLEAVEGKGPLMFAEIAMRKAALASLLLNRHRVAEGRRDEPERYGCSAALPRR